MSLLALPNELHLQIAHCLRRCPTCHCHHISPHLSAFSRSNHRLHALLAEYLLATASTSHMLFWAIANSRNGTVALALERGADPDSPLYPSSHIPTSRFTNTTPVDLAISMRVHSADAELHAQKLGALALLFGAGGTCTVHSLIKPTVYGDLDLLTLCLPHLSDIDDWNYYSGPRTILEVAARRGHVEATKLAINAGATVNSTGDENSSQFYPPLWVCWQCPITVLQVLLDAGADATWRTRRGVSVLQNMRERSFETPELEEKIALLVSYGAVDQSVSWRAGPGGKRNRHPPVMEYRGWVPSNAEEQVNWAQEWLIAEREDRCGCLSD